MNTFDELFKQYAPVVFRFLLSLCGDEGLAEELTAETFYQAYLHIGRFRGDCKIETWLCQIAKNALRKEMRRQKQLVSTELLTNMASNKDLFEAVSDREQILQIYQYLSLLKDTYRDVFLLRISGELSFKEIAEIYQKSESWAKVTFYRGKNKLLEMLEGRK